MCSGYGLSMLINADYNFWVYSGTLLPVKVSGGHISGVNKHALGLFKVA